jgi:hypothetical protein
MQPLMLVWIAAMVAGEPAAPCPPQDTYFVIVFGAQRPIKAARYSHSFATFIRVTPDGQTQEVTISWLPVTGQVRPYALQDEPGRNYSLSETLAYCHENRMRVSLWGPYQVDADLWQRALWQKFRLDSGQVSYKAYDYGSSDGLITNCIHAVEFPARDPEQNGPYVMVAPANWGESGSYWLALTLRPWYLEPCVTHSWVMCRLGLDPAAYAVYDLSRNPTRAPGIRATQGLLHVYLLRNRVNCDR